MACLFGIGWLVLLIWGETRLITGAIDSISQGRSEAGALLIILAIGFFIVMNWIGKLFADLAR